MSEMADAIRALSAERGIDEESIKKTIETMITTAYQKSFGSNYDNCIVKFSDDLSEVHVYSRKTVVDGVYDPVIEIELEEALKHAPDAAIDDSIDVELDPKKDFGRRAVSIGKQDAHKNISDKSSKKIIDEYSSKKGEIMIGYYQRENKGNVYVDIGGKVEGVLPAKFQSPREAYQAGDRIRALVKDVKKINSGVQVVLSRTDENFVRKILELEVPEISDGTIFIKSIAREAGYRTKIAVGTNKIDVDPVGSCVGLKGVRIQNVIHELDGEKIDVLRYDEDPHVFIKNSLSPAEVKKVVIKSMDRREAIALVSDNDFSIAIGKLGQNVRLANKLCDWTIDVRTESQAAELDLTEDDSKKVAAEQLFTGAADEDNEITSILQLDGVDQVAAEIIKNAGYDDIEQFVNAYDEGVLYTIEGITKDQVEAIYQVVCENVVFEDEVVAEEDVEGQDVEAAAEEEEYFCPECGAKITPDVTKCPNCGIDLSFE